MLKPPTLSSDALPKQPQNKDLIDLLMEPMMECFAGLM